jgi:hypothetical protein
MVAVSEEVTDMCQTCRRHHPELYADKPVDKPAAKPATVKKALPKKKA